MVTSNVEEEITLRVFLERGLWPIELSAPDTPTPTPTPPAHPPRFAYSLARALLDQSRRTFEEPEFDLYVPNMRPPSAQTVRVFAATGRRVTMVRDDSDEGVLYAQLEKHLKLEEQVPQDIVEEHARAAAGSRYFSALTEENLLGALSYVYALVNRLIVDPSLRKDPRNAHLWTNWHFEGDTTYLARGLEGASTATSGTADGVCIANAGPRLNAIAILESKISSIFPGAHRDEFHRSLTSGGFTVYLSYASDKLRAWNSTLADGSAVFWAALVAHSHESMHVYKCSRTIATSWINTVIISRRSPNLLACSGTLKWGAEPAGWPDTWPKDRVYLNLLQILLASALCTLDDPLDRWDTHPHSINMIPRAPRRSLEADVHTAPTLPTRLRGWGDGREVHAHFIQTYPEDEDTIGEFLELATDHGHILEFQPGTLLRGQMFNSFRVARTTFIDIPPGVKVIARVFNLASMPYADTKWSLSQGAIRRRVRDEAALYCGVLRPLQGNTVSRFFGLFEGHYGKDKHGIMIMLLEDCGPPLALMREGLDRGVCTQIVKAYERLHAANVVHGDTGVQHVRHSKHTPGEIVLVDFDNAWVVNPARKREKADIDDEYRCVLREYGFEVPEHLRALVPPWEIEE